MRTLRTPFWTSLGWITLLTGAGCNLRALTAESTADLLHAAAPQFDTLEDLDFAEAAAPANLVTMESVYRVVPRNQDVLIELTKGLTGYAFAFLENHMEQARVDDHPETEESFRLRAKGTYRRAKTFGFELLDVRAQVPGGPDG